MSTTRWSSQRIWKLWTLSPLMLYLWRWKRECINVMIQGLWTKDGSLLQGLTIQNEYTELRKGSKNAVMVVRNSMAYPQTLKKKTIMARAVSTTVVPELLAGTRLPEGGTSPKALTHLNWPFNRDKGSYLMLDLKRLESWPPELMDSAHQLLAKYHNVFSLEPAELCCTHST